MTESLENPKSLAAQIIEETLESLKNLEEFDQNIIADLKQLAESGNLKKSQLVAQTLKSHTTKK